MAGRGGGTYSEEGIPWEQSVETEGCRSAGWAEACEAYEAWTAAVAVADRIKRYNRSVPRRRETRDGTYAWLESVEGRWVRLVAVPLRWSRWSMLQELRHIGVVLACGETRDPSGVHRAVRFASEAPGVD